jgi:hydrogenase nickel incorporation protein HypB
MCETCGCGDSDLVPVEVHEAILSENERGARHNRQHFTEARVLAVNLMGAMSGDLATDNDAYRLAAAGIPSLSITTGSACHLDAKLVHEGLHDLPWRETDLLFIENVGNLVCPAVYDLGQTFNVVALSVTEGEDKPLKYPVMFRTADLVLLTKVDLLPHLPQIDVAAIEDGLARTMPDPAVIHVSTITGEGIDRWIEWLEEKRVAALSEVTAEA